MTHHRETILARAKMAKKREPLNLPEWGEGLYVCAMKSAERDAWEAEMFTAMQATGKAIAPNFRAMLVARTVVDSEGKRVFTDADIEQLGECDPTEMRKVYDLASKLNSVSSDDVRELEKKS